MTEKYLRDEFGAELLRDLLLGDDLEEIGRVLGLSGNTIYCFTSKNKPQLPNLSQFLGILDQVGETNPAAVHRALKKICAKYRMFAEALAVLQTDVTRHRGGGG